METEKPRRGRPKSEGPKRERRVSFRMLESDYQRLKEYSQQHELPITESICKAIEEMLQSKGE